MRKRTLTHVEYADPFAALADGTRRVVFEKLRSGPKPVAQLAAGMPVSRPAVSQHLRVLRQAGLVTHDKRGRQNLYSIRPEGLEELQRYLESFWRDALASFKEHAEQGART